VNVPRTTARAVLALGVLLAALGSLPLPVASAGGRQTFSTSESPFRGTANQGWYGSRTGGSTRNNDYLVGKGGQEYRDFFTFDLSALSGNVVAARLVVRRARCRGGPMETLRLFEVATGARDLNLEPKRRHDRAIYHDLGRGPRYGTFDVPVEGHAGNVVDVSLNAQAVQAIESAEGGFFSIGGRLVSIDDGGSLFGHSDARGPQKLIVKTS
jgi:hypothetical protein